MGRRGKRSRKRRRRRRRRRDGVGMDGLRDQEGVSHALTF
jgi:hypothetical protein